jgi:hypothetical protein
MSKRQQTNDLVRIGVFGGLTIASGALFVTGMISNGNGAVERFNALKAADAAGGDVDKALNELRSYIYSHMNTEIGGDNGIYPPIQLSGTYGRLVAAEEQRVKDKNDSLYTEAQSFCEANGNQGFSGRNRLECINGYIDQNGAKPITIEDSLYKYDFVAGFSLISLMIFGAITAILVLGYLRTKRFVHISK